MFIKLRGAPSGEVLVLRAENVAQLLEVKIGVEYDAQGIATREIPVTCVCMSDGQQFYVLDALTDVLKLASVP